MRRNQKMPWYIWLIVALPVFYVGLLIGQYYQPNMNLAQLLEIVNTAFARPFAIAKTAYGIKFGLALLAAYGMGVLYYYANTSNTRKGEEHGSARWANVAHINAKYRDKGRKKKDNGALPQTPQGENIPLDPAIKMPLPGIFSKFFVNLSFKKDCPRREPGPKQIDDNFILSKNVRFSMNSHQHRRNLNMLVVGGSGAGKTRFLLKPNLAQLNCSYVYTDPKSEILYSTGDMFKRAGYKIKVLNLIDMQASDCYNPFHYLKSETDVLKLIKMFVQSTNEKGQKSNDPFWEKSESALLQALQPVKKGHHGVIFFGKI